jgi:hypothetical protein
MFALQELGYMDTDRHHLLFLFKMLAEIRNKQKLHGDTDRETAL